VRGPGQVGGGGAGPAPGAKGAQTRSCSSPVFVEQATEQVPSMNAAFSTLIHDGQSGGRVRRLELQRPVPVVVLDIDSEDLLEVPARHDEQPVQALGARTVRIQRSAPILGYSSCFQRVTSSGRVGSGHGVGGRRVMMQDQRSTPLDTSSTLPRLSCWPLDRRPTVLGSVSS